MSELRSIPIDQIRENKISSLRPVADKNSEPFQGLVNSIKEKGFLGAITVRPATDETSGQPYFELVDGLQRFTAAKEAGLTEIPCNVRDLDDDGVLEAQVLANLQKIETKPVQYSEQLKRMLIKNPMLTAAILAKKLAKGVQWIEDRLGLLNIQNKETLQLVEEGSIPLTNAYHLSKLPADEQDGWVQRAMTEPPQQFCPAVIGRAKEVRDAKRKGLDPDAPKVFQPTPHMQKMKVIADERETLSNSKRLISTAGITDPIAAAKLILDWVVGMDPESIAAQVKKDEERRAKLEVEKAKRQAEKEQKAAEKASTVLMK